MGPVTKGYGFGKHYFAIRFSMLHFVEHVSIQKWNAFKVFELIDWQIKSFSGIENWPELDLEYMSNRNISYGWSCGKITIFWLLLISVIWFVNAIVPISGQIISCHLDLPFFSFSFSHIRAMLSFMGYLHFRPRLANFRLQFYRIMGKIYPIPNQRGPHMAIQLNIY